MPRARAERGLDRAGPRYETFDHRDVFYSDRQKEPGTAMCCCVFRAVSAAPATTSGERPSAVLTIHVP